jgi:hypothetical protein
LFDDRKPPEANRQAAYRPASVPAITIFDGLLHLKRVAVVGKKALQTLTIGRCPKDAADDRGAKESIPKRLVWPQRISKLHDGRATEFKVLPCRGFVALHLVKIRGGRVYAPFSKRYLEVLHSLQRRRKAFVGSFQVSIGNRDSCVCLPS